MRVVRHIQHQSGLAGDDLEAPGQLDKGQPVAHRLGRHRQQFAHGRQCRQHAGGIDQLVGTAQRRIGQSAVTPSAPGPPPLLLVAGDIEVLAHTPQVGTHFQSAVQHALRRHGVAYHHRAAGAHDAGLLPADGFAVVAQQFHVVEVNAGDDGAVGIDDVDGVQAAAQAHFQNRHIQTRIAHHVKNGQGAELKVGQRHRLALHTGAFHGGKAGHQRIRRHRLTVQPQALFKVHQMRRAVNTGLVAGLPQYGRQHGAGGALSVGAGHGDHRTGKAQAHALGHGAHALQAHVDVLGVQLFAIGQPLGQRRKGLGHRRELSPSAAGLA